MLKKFIHVGCGQNYKAQTTRGFNNENWEELRFDIDADVKPDIIGTMTDMSAIGDGSADGLFSSHNIEHLYPHEVSAALSEFRRVLTDEGFVVITCPDLQSVCKLVVEDRLLEAAYQSPAGPITPLDMLYGYRSALEKGRLYMAHRCGFTRKVLTGVLLGAGFESVASVRRESHFDLFALATKCKVSEDRLRELAGEHFP